MLGYANVSQLDIAGQNRGNRFENQSMVYQINQWQCAPEGLDQDTDVTSHVASHFTSGTLQRMNLESNITHQKSTPACRHMLPTRSANNPQVHETSPLALSLSLSTGQGAEGARETGADMWLTVSLPVMSSGHWRKKSNTVQQSFRSGGLLPSRIPWSGR